MRLISKSVVNTNFSIPKFLDRKGYTANFDYVMLDKLTLFTRPAVAWTLHINTGDHMDNYILVHSADKFYTIGYGKGDYVSVNNIREFLEENL